MAFKVYSILGRDKKALVNTRYLSYGVQVIKLHAQKVSNRWSSS